MFNSLTEVRQSIQGKRTSCSELVQHYIQSAEKAKDLNSFLEIYKEEALLNAAEVDKKLQSGKGGKLAGMVLTIKDNICYKGHNVSAASRILEGFESLYNSTVVEKILKEDAILLGRMNCDEFAMGSSNENSAFGPVLNPVDKGRIPGGSSGGGAAAVKAGLCLASLGSDTGGSVRQPASLCGVIGLKPTYGRVSRWGLIAYASSFDQIGLLTRSVYDAALLLEVIAGKDNLDSTSSSEPVQDYANNLQFNRKTKIAYIKECIESPGLNEEIRKRLMEIIKNLRKEGHTVEAVNFPYLDFLVPCYYMLTTAEASSNLARFDGVRYGRRSPNATDMESCYKKSRTEGFGREVQRRIMLGTFVLSAGYYDAYYSKAQKVRRLVRDKTNEILNDYEFIILPATPHPAIKIGQKVNDPVAMYLEDVFTVQANLSGLPAISIPLGLHSSGLPFGIQLIGKKFDEGNLLSFSDYLMKKNQDSY